MLEISLHAGVGHPVSLVMLALIGLFIGYIAGMFGVGGGFLLTPVLIAIVGVPAPVAVGSALCQKCGTSIASFLKYRHLGRGEPRIDLVMLGGSLIGVDAGTRLLAYLSERGRWVVLGRPVPAVTLVLDLVFIVLLSLTTVYVARDALRARGREAPRGDVTIPGPLVTRIRIPPFIDLPGVGLERVSVPMMAYLGFVLGAASGLMGIGGGVLFMPILLYGFGLSVRNAAGTGVLLLFVTVAVGTFEQALHGFVSLRLALALLVGSSVGSQLGALTTDVLPNRILRLLFAVLVAATVVMIAVDLGHLLIGHQGRR
ncbi:sulfite exporter TauE/SafE family protein [Sorangium atrum]|uniref:Probable membrane transporter protein n=1 Tax=Sorangium atrum TaxID=2995308 RepID=A0ABT5C5I8_9BACT|nr:sulfite exporter TauE/SafE family protein [Sorangium aterium]MDC0681213.1 sulfite exporter TauE/SafE family protein [Sorangium aterium]